VVERTLSVRVKDDKLTLGYILRWQLAAFSVGAAAIHFAEISTHFEEYWVFGVFFFAVAWFQAASAVAIVTSVDRRLLATLITVNVITIGIWVWSRTAGLPIGPEAGEPEAIGAADLLATIVELLLVVWVLAVRAPSIAPRTASRGLGLVSTLIVWTGVVAMIAVVFFTATGEEVAH
jgi:hypothetical protein